MGSLPSEYLHSAFRVSLDGNSPYLSFDDSEHSTERFLHSRRWEYARKFKAWKTLSRRHKASASGGDGSRSSPDPFTGLRSSGHKRSPIADSETDDNPISGSAEWDDNIVELATHLVEEWAGSYHEPIDRIACFAVDERRRAAQEAATHNRNHSPTSSAKAERAGPSKQSSPTGTPTRADKYSAETFEDDGQGSARKRRRDDDTRANDSSSDPEARLLACPYSKYDPVRYSETNADEKQYRGCSSCYLVDISRLK